MRFTRSMTLAALLLAQSAYAAGFIATGTGEGTLNDASLYNFPPLTITAFSPFTPFGPSYSGGVRVAVGDINGDHVPDLIAATGSTPQVSVFSGTNASLLQSFNAFPTSPGGVYVASGDINNDGVPDIITGNGSGSTEVRVFSGLNGSLLTNFAPYPAAFLGGVRVAAGDINGDGFADIITVNGPGAAANIRVISGKTGSLLHNFLGYGGADSAGAFVAAGDVNGDGLADIILGPDSGLTPNVKVFSGLDASLLNSFFAYSPSFTGGVRVASGDLDGDGHSDIITGAGPGGSPQVSIFSGLNLSSLGNFFAGTPTDPNGIYVAAAGIPEPATLALLSLGALATLRRPRHR